MKELEIQVNLNFEVTYLPSNRHKYQRTRTEQEAITVSIPKLEEGEAPLAFKVEECNDIENYYYHNRQLWRKVMWHERHHGKDGDYPIEELIEKIQFEAEDLPIFIGSRTLQKTDEVHTKECQLKHLQEILDEYLIIDNCIYTTIGEPRYVINTFGLGHNHGGTGMSVQNWYNSNIPNTSYFPANKREEAITYGKKTAKERGDTEYIDLIGKYCDIKVLMPELVTCDPINEHGEGDSFINSLNKITRNSSSQFEAGLLAIAFTAKELNRRYILWTIPNC